MPQLVTTGAIAKCIFGAAPTVLNFLPTSKVMCPTPAGNISDFKPFLNIPPFAMCMSPANPAVAAATAAAMGVLTPMPCTPNISTPWIPMAPTKMIGPMPGITMNSMQVCKFGGLITINFPGQMLVQAS
jgi:hypothetical protein